MTYQLPPLPYAYNALEPVIDARTMEIHYSKHHQAYVDNLNKALADKPYGSVSLEELLQMVQEVPPVIRNNAGGHYNHSLFWTLLTPPSSLDLSPVQPIQEATEKKPEGELAEEIYKEFSSFENFKTKFAEAATTRFGSGWAWLLWSADEKKLKISSTPNQDNPLMNLPEIVKGEPLLGLDVWEHAYYLHYQNRRPEYINAFWKVINWKVVNERFVKSK